MDELYELDEPDEVRAMDSMHCQCCGGKTPEGYCITCHHTFNDWCARGDGKCGNCGGLLDDDGKCDTTLPGAGGKCGWQRTRENSIGGQ